MLRALIVSTACLLFMGAASVVVAEDAKTEEAKKPDAKGKYDMSPYKALAEEALKLVQAGDTAKALEKTLELEKKFDEGTKALRAADRKVWKTIDIQMDVAIEACKGEKPDKDKATAALNDFIAKLALADKVK